MLFARRFALAFAGLALAASACGNSSALQSDPRSNVKPATLHGALPGAVIHIPNVTLVDTNGVSHDLATDARKKVLLLYFGYTHCLDECPTTMADVARGLALSPSWVRSGVEVAFVTTDPRRDTAPVLRRWLDRFSTSFVGLSGTPQQIQTAERALKLPLAQEQPAKPSDHVGAYAVNHFSAVLAYDRHAQLVALYPTGVTPSAYAQDLPVLVADKVKPA